MSDLDESGRALIALAQDAHDPTDADRARVRAALSGRLGAVAGLGAVTGLAATAKAAVAGSTLATKLVGAAVVVTTAVGVGASVKLALHAAQVPAAKRTSQDAPRRTSAAAPAALAAPAPVPEEATSAAPAPIPPAVDPAPSQVAAKRETPKNEAPKYEAPSRESLNNETPNDAPSIRPLPPLPEMAAPAKMDTRDATGAVPHHRSPSAAGARDQACAPARRSESAVADEARLVHDGVAALRAGQAACALSLLETHARFYPEGVLAEEREAERALALADLGRVAEARLAAASFLRKHPTSPLGVRLRHRIPGVDGADGSR